MTHVHAGRVINRRQRDAARFAVPRCRRTPDWSSPRPAPGYAAATVLAVGNSESFNVSDAAVPGARLLTGMSISRMLPLRIVEVHFHRTSRRRQRSDRRRHGDVQYIELRGFAGGDPDHACGNCRLVSSGSSCWSAPSTPRRRTTNASSTPAEFSLVHGFLRWSIGWTRRPGPRHLKPAPCREKSRCTGCVPALAPPATPTGRR